MVRKICLKRIFFLKLYAMKVRSNCRHLVCNQIKTRKRMRTRWPPRWQFITQNIRKSSVRLVSSRNLHAKFYFTDFWTTNILVTFQWCYYYNTSFSILYIQDDNQDGTWQVLQPCECSILPVGMSDGFVTGISPAYMFESDPIPCLIEQHFTSMRRWIHEPSMHVWYSWIVQAGISESGTGSSYMPEIMAPLCR